MERERNVRGREDGEIFEKWSIRRISKKKMEKRNKFGIKNLQTNIIIHIVRQ